MEKIITKSNLNEEFQKLIKRIKYLESLHVCTCPSEESKYIITNGGWSCALHGTFKIHSSGPINGKTTVAERFGGHQI